MHLYVALRKRNTDPALFELLLGALEQVERGRKAVGTFPVFVDAPDFADSLAAQLCRLMLRQLGEDLHIVGQDATECPEVQTPACPGRFLSAG